MLMDGAMNKKSRVRAGTSLVEVLVVIVIFLVGILAVVQIFPPGLRILRDSKNSVIANALAQGEMERISGQQDRSPEMIVPVSYTGPNAFQAIDVSVNPEELSVPLDSGVGRINSNGNVVIGGNQVAHWGQMSGTNRFSRVIGEGGAVPAPRQVGSYFGGLIQPMFAPILFNVDSSTLRGRTGQLIVYGNDLVGATGDLSDQANLIPSINETSVDPSTFYYIPGTKSQNSPVFVNEDQLWIGAPINSVTSTPYEGSYRIAMSIQYNEGGTPRNLDAILVVGPTNTSAYSRPSNSPYIICSVPQLISVSGLFGSAGLNPANYIGVDPSSIRVQRVFDEISSLDGWNQGNPYQYKVLSLGLGSILVNQFAAGVKVRDANGDQQPLLARLDYTVFDWRIIRDEFRAPAVSGGSQKLKLNSIKTRNGTNADGKLANGISGTTTGDLSLYAPGADGVNGPRGVILFDLTLGAVILGDDPANANSAYTIDYTRGTVTFRSVNTALPGIQAYVAYPRGDWQPGSGAFAIDPNFVWSATSSTVDISNHQILALYRGNSEFAVQVMKSARSYRVAYPSSPSLLTAGQCYVGGSNGWGSANKLYFPISDANQKVVIGESILNSGVVRDKDYLTALDPTTGLAAITLPVGSTFDFTQRSYSVRWVRGASMKVRVLWNPEQFSLGSDPIENYNRFVAWSRSWRKTEGELHTGGAIQ